MKKASREPSPFAWKTFAPKLLEAMDTNSAEAFCAHWLPQLGRAHMIATMAAELNVEKLPADHVELTETRDSLRLVKNWYLPSRSAASAARAAGALHDYIGGQLDGHPYLDLGAGNLPERERQQLEQRAGRIRKLRSHTVFLARVAARLATYQVSPSRSPAAAVRQAIEAELAQEMGVTSARPKRSALGQELRRLFQLPEGDPQRGRLQACLVRLGSEQRKCVSVLYAQRKTYKELGWSGRKIDRVRRTAIESLVRCMPELQQYL